MTITEFLTAVDCGNAVLKRKARRAETTLGWLVLSEQAAQSAGDIEQAEVLRKARATLEAQLVLELQKGLQ